MRTKPKTVKARVTVYADGTTTLSTKTQLEPQPSDAADYTEPTAKAKRSTIKDFTRQSRSRFAAEWRSCDWGPNLEAEPNSPTGKSFFICLNMPEGHTYSSKDFAAARNRYSKYMADFYGDLYLGGPWKSELSEEGLLHLHVVVFFRERQQTSDITAAVKTIWAKATKCTDPAELLRAVHVEACYRGKHRPLCGDLLNYLLKQPVAAKGVEWSYGKCWGVFQSKRVPRCPPVVLTVEGEAAEAAKLLLIKAYKDNPDAAYRKKVQLLSDNWRGFTLPLDPEVTAEVIYDFEHRFNNLLAAFE